jgi:orotate phosphoribosyltransferase
VVLVDDVVSAGSAIRASHLELGEAGAQTVAGGTLLLLGELASEHFGRLGLPIEAVIRDGYDSWEGSRCPLCAAGVPVEDPS